MLFKYRRRSRRSLPSIFMICIFTLIYLVYREYGIMRDAEELQCQYQSTITGDRIIFDNTSEFIHHYSEFICPQNFRNLADWIYGWPEGVFNEIFDILNISSASIRNLPAGSIIYVKTDRLSSFFTEVYPYLINKFVLITGQGGTQTPGEHIRYLEERHSKIIHWFAQNGDIDATKNERFTHIPVGINCFEMAEGIRDVHRQYPKHILPSVRNNNPDEPPHYIQPLDVTQSVLTNNIQLDKLVLINFSPDTDPTGVRRKLYKDLCENKQSSFTICYDKPGGVNISSLPTIYRRNRQYPLWVSPRGTGIDCHRTWEALYLDIIPIVWHSTLDPLYTNLPIIIINDWSEVNEEFLRNKLHEIAMKKAQQPSVYQYEKLRIAYWREMIIRKSRYAFESSYTRRNRCWRGKTIQ